MWNPLPSKTLLAIKDVSSLYTIFLTPAIIFTPPVSLHTSPFLSWTQLLSSRTDTLLYIQIYIRKRQTQIIPVAQKLSSKRLLSQISNTVKCTYYNEFAPKHSQIHSFNKLENHLIISDIDDAFDKLNDVDRDSPVLYNENDPTCHDLPSWVKLCIVSRKGSSLIVPWTTCYGLSMTKKILIINIHLSYLGMWNAIEAIVLKRNFKEIALNPNKWGAKLRWILKPRGLSLNLRYLFVMFP